MRTLWQGLVRIVFWSFERGTLPYDAAVVVIVLFVLLSPRSWFDDRPRPEVLTASALAPATVERHGSDPIDGAAIFRVDARLISDSGEGLEEQLREAVRRHAYLPAGGDALDILRYNPVRGSNGAVAFYDVCIKQ